MLSFFLTQPCFDFVHGLFERPHTRFGVLFHLDDVVTEGCLNHFADVPRFHVEGCLLERLDHGTAGEVAEVTSLYGACRVIGVHPGELGEIFSGLDLFKQFFSESLLLFADSFIRTFINLDQDMRGLDLFEDLELLEVATMILVELVLVESHFIDITLWNELQVPQGHHLRGSENFLLLCKVGGEGFISHLDLFLKGRRRQADIVKVNFLVVVAKLFIDLFIGDRNASLQLLTNLTGYQFAALHRFELLAVQTLVGEDLQITILAENAVLLKGRDVGDGVDQFFAADLNLLTLCFVLQQCLVYQAVERFLGELQLLFEGGRKLVLVDVLVDLVEVAVGGLEIIVRDGLAIDDCSFSALVFTCWTSGRGEHGVADDEAEDDDGKGDLDDD